MRRQKNGKIKVIKSDPPIQKPNEPIESRYFTGINMAEGKTVVVDTQKLSTLCGCIPDKATSRVDRQRDGIDFHLMSTSSACKRCYRLSEKILKSYWTEKLIALDRIKVKEA